MSDWHELNMEIAKMVAMKSQDPSTKVGAVITLRGEIVSSGFNKIPGKILHTVHQMEDRSWKYPRIIHAEQDAIMSLPRTEFLSGRVHLYCTHFPCERCAAMIAHAGIDEVFTRRIPQDFMERWGASVKLAQSILDEAGVAVTFLEV